jgi:hypothetical protein
MNFADSEVVAAILEKNGFGQVYNGGGWFSLKAIVESL